MKPVLRLAIAGHVPWGSRVSWARFRTGGRKRVGGAEELAVGHASYTVGRGTIRVNRRTAKPSAELFGTPNQRRQARVRGPRPPPARGRYGRSRRREAAPTRTIGPPRTVEVVAEGPSPSRTAPMSVDSKESGEAVVQNPGHDGREPGWPRSHTRAPSVGRSTREQSMSRGPPGVYTRHVANSGSKVVNSSLRRRANAGHGGEGSRGTNHTSVMVTPRTLRGWRVCSARTGRRGGQGRTRRGRVVLTR